MVGNKIDLADSETREVSYLNRTSVTSAHYIFIVYSANFMCCVLEERIAEHSTQIRLEMKNFFFM